MLIVNLSQNKSDLNYYISSSLLEKIKNNLKENKKSILYLNKRGNFSLLICTDCSYYYKCMNCDVSLTVHNNPKKLACHVCGSSLKIPKSCSKCNRSNLKNIGIGTKQIEESLKNHFNDKVSIFRFDLDSTKNKKEKKLSLERLEKSDIIIATKMIITGFDFKNIGLIAVILAEQEFNFPSYNSEEKAYINIQELIGRGNRLGDKTEIIIQTFIPDNEVIKTLSEKNYKNFFLDTLKERKLFSYPPFIEMLTLEYRDKSEKKSLDFMVKLKNKLDLINTEGNIEIVLNKKSFKKYNKFHIKIILKGNKLRDFIENIKSEIFRNSNLSVIF